MEANALSETSLSLFFAPSLQLQAPQHEAYS